MDTRGGGAGTGIPAGPTVVGFGAQSIIRSPDLQNVVSRGAFRGTKQKERQCSLVLHIFNDNCIKIT